MRPDDPDAPTGPLRPDEKIRLDGFEHPPPPSPANAPLAPVTP